MLSSIPWVTLVNCQIQGRGHANPQLIASRSKAPEAHTSDWPLQSCGVCTHSVQSASEVWWVRRVFLLGEYASPARHWWAPLQQQHLHLNQLQPPQQATSFKLKIFTCGHFALVPAVTRPFIEKQVFIKLKYSLMSMLVVPLIKSVTAYKISPSSKLTSCWSPKHHSQYCPDGQPASHQLADVYKANQLYSGTVHLAQDARFHE